MLINKFKQITSGQFIRNVGWLGGAELVNRIFRLGTTVTLARMFSSQDYGLAAIIYTVYEFALVFTLKYGIDVKIIQADERDVKTLCNTSYWLNWILCGWLFIIQCIAAYPIAHFYGNQQLFWPICTVAFSYLMSPLFIVNSALIQRENRLKIIAFCNALQGIISNVVTVILAILGMGIWAVVLPIVLTNPLWIIISYKNHKWRPPKSFQLERWQEIVNFAKNLLAVDMLSKLRANLDYLIVGHFLGIEALGVYYFAFNAGLGISLNVMNSFMSALFPHLCAVRDNFQQFKSRFFNSLKMLALIFIPLITMQSILAPFYVPIIFGEKWVSSIPVLIIICLSAIPHAFWWAFSLVLNAMDKSHVSLYLDVIFTIIFVGVILLSVQGGILWVAVAVLISKVLALPVFMPFLKKYLTKNSLQL
jgi:PST family polysaccharide transporter